MDKLPDNKYKQFRSVYKNLSLNDDIFELRCFERYFYVLEYCLKANIKRLILCDSDVLIFENLYKYFKSEYRAFSHLQTKPDGMAVSPHCSLWSIEDLESFVDFLLYYYQNNVEALERIFNDYKNIYNKGGICDMTLIYLWLRDKELPYFNTAIASNAGGGNRSLHFKAA